MKSFCETAAIAFLVVLLVQQWGLPDYKITQEYRSDWGADRFYLYRKTGACPLCMYVLDLPSYSDRASAEKSARQRQSGKERIIGYVP